MDQAQLQDATNRLREEEKKGESGAVFGMLMWGFILWALYRYFFE